MTFEDEAGSWLESRRLILSQLRGLDASIRELSGKMDRFNETSRERLTEMSKESHQALGKMEIRLAMLELRAKIWGGAVGIVGGAIGTGLIELITHSIVLRR